MLYDDIIKICLVGDPSVGKTALINKIVNNKITTENIQTTGIEFYTKDIFKDKKKIRLQLWDTPSHEKLSLILRSYFNMCDAIILIFDITKFY